MNKNRKSAILRAYLEERIEQPYKIFSLDRINELDEAINFGINLIPENHPLLSSPINKREAKPVVDDVAIKLWNDIFPSKYHVKDLVDAKSIASEFINNMDTDHPDGDGASEPQLVQYLTAQSASSFMGIQNPKYSMMSNESMRSTIQSHSNPQFKEREWLIPNLQFVAVHIKRNSHIMERDYSHMCMAAKYSASSIEGEEKKFRTHVLKHDINDLLYKIKMNEIPMMIRTGVRNDRRGKYRLVCSFDGRFRIVDYLLNNGSYELCEGDGILAKWTTEGFNNALMWPELVKMSDRRNSKTMICLDYKGYDTQISMLEYLEISRLLNAHRIDDNAVYSVFWDWYETWMRQPKPLIQLSEGIPKIVVPYYRTLASGLHGTHSFQNMIGISTTIEAQKRGIKIHDFWANGDDQNSLIDSSDVKEYIAFVEETFLVSWEKSLVGHRLAVWGKLWFTSDFHPAWEIGTFRSIWEKEGEGSTFVSPSKLQSNYCKILQVAITLIRLGKNDEQVKFWIDYLSSLTDVGDGISLDPDRIPIRLNNLTSSSKTTVVKDIPKGLNSVASELRRRTFRFRSVSDSNWYDLLMNMYKNMTFYSLDVEKISYHPKHTKFRFGRGIDYAKMVPNDVPWTFKDLWTGREYSDVSQFNRDVLQSTKSYDGPSSMIYEYHDMLTLAHSINERNKHIWVRFTQHLNR